MYTTQLPPEVLKQNKGPLLLSIIWIFASLALIVVSIKVWTRIKVLHQSGLEDLFVLLAWVLSLVYGAMLTASVHYGFGKHPSAIDSKAILIAIKLYAAAIPFGIFSVSLPTLAIAIVLKKITAPSTRQIWFLYGMPALNVAIKVVNVVLILTTCPPTSIHDGLKILSSISRIIAAAQVIVTGFSAATDVFLTVWPIVAFWKLQLKQKTKVVLLLLFSTTAVIEGDVIIITACVPGLRPFVKHLRQKTKRNQCLDNLQAPKRLSSNSGIVGPSSVSIQRTEPQGSGSISHSDQLPRNHTAYKCRSLERIPSKMEDADKQAFEGWRALEGDKRRHGENQTAVRKSPLIERDPGEGAGEKKRWVS
ncbi:MAG: hypothetical protein Q9213_002556 [Squamulea squamosa]